jgi:hypothetical protein
MRTVRAALGVDLVTPVVGALLTIAAAYASVHAGARIGLGALLAATILVGSVAAFRLVPHIAVAVTIPLFAFIPFLKIFVGSSVGPVKDIVTIGAAAAALLVLARGWPPYADRFTLGVAAVFLALYVIDAGGGHGNAWAQGVRLVAEPMVFLFAGMLLPSPVRTLRFAVASLIATASVVAAYGLLQQYVGQWRLVGWGYSFSAQVRTYHGLLRSFGTLDDPFVYATLLMLGVAGVLLWRRRSLATASVLVLLSLGAAVSYVRTALLMAVALLGLLLARAERLAASALLMTAAVAVGLVLLVGSTGASETRTYRTTGSLVTLNGRTSAWAAAFGTPAEWVYGRGVGAVGTAAQRASYGVTAVSGSVKGSGSSSRAVDSGYFAVVADVGLLGLAVLLVLFARLGYLATGAVADGHREGWLAAGVIAVMLLDALTRSSFTSFPTAAFGLLFIGLSLASARTPFPGHLPPSDSQL